MVHVLRDRWTTLAQRGQIMNTIDIEALLVWTYRDQKADRAEAQNRSLGYGLDSSLRVERAACGGAGPVARIGSGLHPDAEAVHAAVLGLSRFQQELVIRHARVNGRPDWMPGARPVMAGVLTSRGTTARIYDANGNAIGHKVRCGVECGSAVYYGWTMERVADVRSFWAAWWDALADLAEYLRIGSFLTAHSVGGPAVLARPWEATPGEGRSAA